MKIHFNHTSIHALKLKKKILKSLSDVISSGSFLEGKQNEIFLKNLNKYFRHGYVVNVASGHDALVLALSCLSLKKNDEIIFPVNAYPTAFPLFLAKAKPIPVDVEENGQIDVDALKKKISKKTKVIILVHLYGLVGRLDEVVNLCKKNSIILIEDCAQSFGSKYKGQLVGTFGDIACFSFYPTKNLGTLGDGGAIWTKHEQFYNYLVQAKTYGESERYNSNFISGHSRLPEIQVAILNLYLKYLPWDIMKKNKIYEYYRKKLNESKLNDKIRILKSHPRSTPVLHLFVIEAKDRDDLRKYLKSNSIETLVHYPYPVHLVSAFDTMLNKDEKYPMTERLARGIISLPFHQYLTRKQIDFIVKNIKNFYEQA